MQNSNRALIFFLLILGTVALCALLLKSKSHRECWFCSAQGKYERGLEFACSDKPEDKELAFTYISEAADDNVADADLFLAILYSGGELQGVDIPDEARCLSDSVSANATEARRYLDMAAARLKEEGKVSPEVAYRIGNMYLSPVFSQEDPEGAKHAASSWFALAAEGGHLDSALQLARFAKESGNDREAMQWHAKAAQIGKDPGIYLKMGDYYLYGHGTSIDYQKALEWYQKACGLIDEKTQHSDEADQDAVKKLRHLKDVCTVRSDIAKRKLARSGNQNPINVEYRLYGNALHYVIEAKVASSDGNLVKVGEITRDDKGEIHAEVLAELPAGLERDKTGFESMNHALDWVIGQWVSAQYGKGTRFSLNLVGPSGQNKAQD